MDLVVYFLDKTNLIVPCLTACFLLYTRSAGVAYFTLGAIACSLSVKVVKKLVRQPRPVGKSKKSSYGMPSTHSASITYYACYICAACRYLPPHKSLAHVTEKSLQTLVPSVVIYWALLVVSSRVWLGHHTWRQVVVGSAYGAGFAGLWLALWMRGRLDALGSQGEDILVRFLG